VTSHNNYLKASSFQQRDLVVQIKFRESWNELGKPDHVTNDLVETLLELLPATVAVRRLATGRRVFNLQHVDIQYATTTISSQQPFCAQSCVRLKFLSPLVTVSRWCIQTADWM